MPATSPGLTAASSSRVGRSTAICAAVIVHYRDADATLRCLASLAEHAPGTPVVLVDNASIDGSLARLEATVAAMRNVTLLRSPHNGGFGAGCNLGIAHALAAWRRLQFVLLLNPDAQLTHGALQNLVELALRRPRAGIVGCRIVDGQGRAWFENGRLPRWTLSRFHTAPATATEHRCGFVTGCCMLVAADLLRDGLRFHEPFFLYGEDADLCCEVQARGRELWLTQRARIVHQGGGSLPGEPVLGELNRDRLYWLTRSKVLLARRRLTRLQRASFWLCALLLKPLLGMLLQRSAAFLPAYLRGLRDGHRLAQVPPRRRRR